MVIAAIAVSAETAKTVPGPAFCCSNYRAQLQKGFYLRLISFSAALKHATICVFVPTALWVYHFPQLTYGGLAAPAGALVGEGGHPAQLAERQGQQLAARLARVPANAQLSFFQLYF